MDKFPIFASWVKDREIKEAEEKKRKFVGSGDNETVAEKGDIKNRAMR